MAYYLIPQRFRHVWLLAASYFCYLCWDVRFVVFLLFSTVTTYLTGLLIGRIRSYKNAHRKAALALCTVVNVGLLVVFKYTHFFLNTVNVLLEQMGIAPVNTDISLLLPVGISFYTLQVVGYLVDIYRGKVEPEKDFLRYALFVSFFPQTLSGPIARAGEMLPQYRALPARMDWTGVRSGMLRMLWGMFIKLVITERLAILVNTVFDAPADYKGIIPLLAAVAYGLQIYCDFVSYSHLALGAGEVLGIKLKENFNTPYFSLSVAEFWRRWHISLSSWFRDYIYIPLGGNRKGVARKHLNLMIVFAVSGLWHGADWTFVVWGLLNGAFQVIGDITKNIRAKLANTLGMDTNNAGNKLFRMMVTFVLIDFCWIFFRADTMTCAWTVITNIFKEPNLWAFFDGTLLKLGLGGPDLMITLFSLLVLLAVSIANYRGIVVREHILDQSAWLRHVVLYVGIFAVLIFGMYGPSYSASNFIYARF